MTKLHKQMSIFLSVALLMSCNTSDNNNSNKDSTTTITNAVTNNKITTCYIHTFKKDTTRVSLTIEGNVVKGKMDWIPFEKDGARGTLTGDNINGELVLLYNYMIEGISQTETKVMKIENDKLLIKRGELVDEKNDGNLKYKDVATAVYSDTLHEADCSIVF